MGCLPKTNEGSVMELLMLIQVIWIIKGWGEKTRSHETLTNGSFKVFSKYFLIGSVYCRNKSLELIQNTFFMDVEKN